MGVAETLLNTHDITQGLRMPWRPPSPLRAAVLSRLFPDAPPGDPVQILLWSTAFNLGARPTPPRRDVLVCLSAMVRVLWR